MSASFIISVCLVCFSLISASCLGIKANCSLNSNANNFKSASSISCFDFGKSLTELERHAKVIITGTVEKLIPSINDVDTLSAIVRIRRVFKGQEYLKIKNDSTTSEIHRAINVSGLYDFTICESIVKEKDTKIFFLNKIADGSYRINSSLLTINLKNLDSVEAAVKGRAGEKVVDLDFMQNTSSFINSTHRLEIAKQAAIFVYIAADSDLSAQLAENAAISSVQLLKTAAPVFNR